MLEYVKMILKKVSFDKFLFEKELRKSISNYLLPEEIDKLKRWCRRQFKSDEHKLIINQCFTFAYSN